MIYAIYRVYNSNPNIGYYWGKYEDPVKLAYACFNLGELAVADIKVVTYSNYNDIKGEVIFQGEC